MVHTCLCSLECQKDVKVHALAHWQVYAHVYIYKISMRICIYVCTDVLYIYIHVYTYIYRHLYISIRELLGYASWDWGRSRDPTSPPSSVPGTSFSSLGLSRPQVSDMGGCQNHGPLLGPLNTRCRIIIIIIIRTQKRPKILATTHIWGYSGLQEVGIWGLALI